MQCIPLVGISPLDDPNFSDPSRGVGKLILCGFGGNMISSRPRGTIVPRGHSEIIGSSGGLNPTGGVVTVHLGGGTLRGTGVFAQKTIWGLRKRFGT